MASKYVSKEVIAGIEAAALECPLCMERFTEPKSLPCIHSFCLHCLEKWTKERQGRLSCPICREDCQIPTGGLKKLPNNTFVIGLLEYVTSLEQKSTPTCACEKKAHHFCRDCDELYCTECKDTHAKRKINKGHTMMTLEEYKSINPVKEFASKLINCPKHTMPFQFFCATCKELVCVGCTLVEHPTSGHNIINTKDAYETFSTLACQLVKKSDEKLLKFHAVNNELIKAKSVLNSNFSKCKTDITRQADELHRLIDRHKEDQLQKIEESHRQKLKSLETKISDMELVICKLSSMRGITQNMLNCPNQVMTLMSSFESTGRLQELVESEDRVGYQDVGVLAYKPDIKLSRLLEIDVVKQLRGPETQISPNKSMLFYDRSPVPAFMKKFLGMSEIDTSETRNCIETRNALGQCVYIIDAQVKCLAINRMEYAQDRERNIRKKITMINVTDKQNGVYEFPTGISLKACTLLCLIIDRSETYFSAVEFNENGRAFIEENHFQPLPGRGHVI